jgi:hypothetical protein
VYGIDKGMDAAHRGAEMRIPKVFRFIIKYVSPVYLLTIFVLWCSEKLPGYIATLSEGGVPLFSVLIIGCLIVFFSLLIHLASARWDAARSDSG